jgi:hypothetical protein
MLRMISAKIPYEIEPGIFWCEPRNLGEPNGNLRAGGSAVVGALGELQPRALKDAAAHTSRRC